MRFFVFTIIDITYQIKTKTETLSLNEGNYYLEIYGSTNNLLEKFKLLGTLTTTAEERSYTFDDMRFNPSSVYYARIQNFTEEEYPELILSSDESGLASLICSLDKNIYEYVFENYSLKTIKHQFEYNNTNNLKVYLSKYQEYSNYSDIINQIVTNSSTTEETDLGFKFTANLNLEIFNKEKLKQVDNNNYYDQNTQAKKINYEMKVQGFICK